MNNPFFSVVLPTRNRAKLLPFAVESALNQSFEDFELIISDNSSTDETPKIGRSFDDRRVKYFRSEKSLTIGDSCEFAASHARGKYLTFLSDDDAYARIFLERLSSVIEREKTEIVSTPLAFYYARETSEYGRTIPAESLVVRRFDRKLSILKRSEAVRALFATASLAPPDEKWSEIYFPVLVNSAFAASMVERVRARVSKIFPIMGSDIYSSALFLNATEKFCYLDEPLYLHQIWEGGITSGGAANFQKHAEPLEFVPLKKLVSVQNYHADAFLRARRDWGADFEPVALDFGAYFVAYYQELKTLQSKGIDVSEAMAEFEREIQKQDQSIQEKFRLAKSSFLGGVKSAFRGKLKNSFLGRAALKLKHKELTVLTPKEAGFSSISECASKIDEDFLKKHAAEIR